MFSRQLYSSKLFLIQNAWACFFPCVIFGSLALSRMFSIPLIPRYDLLLLICLLTQVFMVRSGMETLDEIKVISLFHLLGLGMELFKVSKGSWSYPEIAFSKWGGVPLYSGFMYASVASYLCQVWRRFAIRMENFPAPWIGLLLAGSIYLNFFTHHYMMDLRWILAAITGWIFRKTVLQFTIEKQSFKMPMLLAFGLVGSLVWIAENVATYLGAWEYAHQHQGWEMVGTQKLSSWMLMVVVSVLLVAELKRIKSNLPIKTSVAENLTSIQTNVASGLVDNSVTKP